MLPFADMTLKKCERGDTCSKAQLSFEVLKNKYAVTRRVERASAPPLTQENSHLLQSAATDKNHHSWIMNEDRKDFCPYLKEAQVELDVLYFMESFKT